MRRNRVIHAVHRSSVKARAEAKLGLSNLHASLDRANALLRQSESIARVGGCKMEVRGANTTSHAVD